MNVTISHPNSSFTGTITVLETVAVGFTNGTASVDIPPQAIAVFGSMPGFHYTYGAPGPAPAYDANLDVSVNAIVGNSSSATGGALKAAYGAVRKLLDSQFAWFGDSITGIGEQFPSYASVLSSQRINYDPARLVSHGGYTSAQLAALTAEITGLNPLPHVVHVHAGANDAQETIPLATFQTNMMKIIGDMKAAGIAVIVGGVLPLAATNARPFVRQYNDWLHYYCATQGLTMIDYYSLFANRTDGSPKAALISGDGVHPNAAGLKVMGQAIVDTLTPVLAPVSAPLAGDNTDATNMITNALALTDSNSDGVPDNWTPQGTTTGWTFSLVDDGQATGKWIRMVGSGATAQGTLVPDAITTGFSVGDTLQLACRVRTSNLADSTSQLYMQLQAFDASFNLLGVGKLIYGITQPVTGIAAGKFVVPASTSRMALYFQGGPGNGTYEVADVTIVNLTKLGIA
jgi:lysophospholipase L1-like esterase